MSNYLINTFFNNTMRKMLEKEIDKFILSAKTSFEFAAYFRKDQRNLIREIAKSKGLKFRTHFYNGKKKIKIYKANEFDSIVESSNCVSLTDESKSIIFTYLTEHPLNQKEKNYMSPYYESCQTGSKPKIPIYRFCIGGTSGNIILRVPPKSSNLSQSKAPILNYKPYILQTIRNNSVTLICGVAGSGKTTQVPQFILEEASLKNEHCRILSSETHSISATINSEIVANQRGEFIGLSVGYQIPLESICSTSSNLLFTTSSFILRCLMGCSIRDVFEGITHVIIDDVHEREAYSDVLLIEVKEALNLYPQLKIILLCSPTDLVPLKNYFKELIIIEIQNNLNIVSEYFLEDILLFSTEQNMLFDKNSTQECSDIMDKCLDTYFINGNDDNFNYFVYLVQEKGFSINTPHSKTNQTAVITAVLHNQVKHLHLLLNLNANPFQMDSNNKTALNYAVKLKYIDCIEILNKQVFNWILNAATVGKAENLLNLYQRSEIFEELDHNLIFSLIHFIHENCGSGAIVVFLPIYEDLVQQEYIIKNNILDNKIKSNIKIYLFNHDMHNSMYKSTLDDINTGYRKIILTTDVAETSVNIHDATFVINCGRQRINQKLQWISKECTKRRSIIAGRRSNGYCFHVFPRNKYDMLSNIRIPELLKSSLEKICLYVKLLSPYVSIRDYLKRSVQYPLEENIHRTINFLETIDALDKYENITSLGIRLIDIPVDVQLGKSLIFGIILQCLDPVLSIVSGLLHKNIWVISNDSILHERAHNARKTFAEDTNSDHLVLLRIYQKWQEARSVGNEESFCKENCILNGVIEAICNIRSQIIGSLRAAGLIHSNGCMSMHFINANANNWALVKSCFLTGLYPNICQIDRNCNKIKSNQSNWIVPLETSVLQEGNIPINDQIKTYQSDWISFHELILEGKYNKIECNTLITSIAVALFAGNIRMCEDDLILIDANIKNELQLDDTINWKNKILYNVDEWITFIMDSDTAYLLYALRQKFFNLFLGIMQMSGEPDVFRKTKQFLQTKYNVIKVLGSVLSIEDSIKNLYQPNNIGERPKSLILKSSRLQKTTFQQMNIELSNFIENINGENKKFFLIEILKISEKVNYFYQKPWLSNSSVWIKIIEKIKKTACKEIITFLFIKDLKIFCSVARIDVTENFFLKQMVIGNISFNDFGLGLKHMSEFFNGEELNPEIGQILLDSFVSHSIQSNF